ncbi:hypothetical protein NHX12_033228 [Muraenolepis orangiensis]|uniref:Uncharacterized protein n=1 Tax=Muraenolepis orangiensis TaxID=630683 RepID=A0A9Q0E290_9TELE|nr:hypothetical protein NHX12_033228 [Muraenolepis orangiensis]
MWITSTPQLCSVQTPRPGELKVQAQNSHEGTATTSTAVPATLVCTTVPVAAAHESGECLPGSEGRRMAALREIWQRSASDLEGQQQQQLWQLIGYQDCFSWEEKELGQTPLLVRISYGCTVQSAGEDQGAGLKLHPDKCSQRGSWLVG